MQQRVFVLRPGVVAIFCISSWKRRTMLASKTEFQWLSSPDMGSGYLFRSRLQNTSVSSDTTGTSVFDSYYLDRLKNRNPTLYSTKCTLDLLIRYSDKMPQK